jgi:arylsulfatase A-like enzyme/Tfp pilus assembly protein PilF
MRGFQLWLFVFFSIYCAGATLPANTPASRNPNIILITLDTTRADRMGFLGSGKGLTPNLDALAKQSVIYERAYSHVPLTPPSHATILTGTYPQYTHLRYMGQPLEADLPYLPDLLRKHGYHTGAFVGSMILDPENVTAIGFQRGFDVYGAGFHQPKENEDRYLSVERRAEDVVNRAMAWVNKISAGPFFLWVHCYDPHGPYDPPEPYKTRYASFPYDGEIANTYGAMGKLIANLKARGLYENSIIVVTADHGEAFGEHGETHHGVFLYDETIHVPMIVKLPRERSSGERVASRVQLVDIAPTVLALSGMKIPSAMQGKVLPGTEKGPAAETQAEDRPAFAESIYAHRAFGWSVIRSWRASKYLYIDSPKRELYDQVTDAKAANNMADSSRAVADTLKSQLDQFLTRTASAGEAKSELNPEQAENLRALGYLPSTSGGSGNGDVGGIDPKDKIEIANLLTQALFDAQEGRYEAAIPRLEQVLKQEPETPLAYFELGRAYSRQKQPDRAVPLLREAVKRLPDDGMAKYELGRALFETGDPAGAAEAFEEAVKLLPKSVEMRFYMAVSYQRAKRIPEAIREYKETLALDPKHFRANLLLGRQLGMEGKATEALPYLKTAVKVDPKSVEAHTFLANVYTLLGQEMNAKKERAEVERLKAGGTP